MKKRYEPIESKQLIMNKRLKKLESNPKKIKIDDSDLENPSLALTRLGL
jgi:hypothetical protein